MSEEAGRAVLAANMKIVHERWPEIARALLAAPRPAEFVVTRQQPSPTLFINGIHLSSGYDPVREAELQAALVPNDSRIAWVYGVGCGHVPRVLLAREAIGKVTVVIMNTGVAALSFSCFEHADWLADPRVELVLAEAEQEVQVPFVAVPSSLQLASEEAARLRDLVFLELATPFSEKCINRKKEKWLPRFQENIAFLKNDGDVASLFGTQPGQSMVIAAAGPTLSGHYAWLRSLCAQKVLIAVDASLKPLLAAGIIPDIVVCIDGEDAVVNFFKDVDLASCEKCVLVYSPLVSREVLESWPGARLVLYLQDPLFEGLAREFSKGVLFSSGSVLHPATDLAVKMGAAEIILLGADFSFPGGVSHASGCAVARDRTGVPAAHWVLDGNGEKVATSTNFRGFLRDLERYIRDHSQVRFVNGSRRGAKIAGTSYLDEGHCD